jgi:transcriptional regulator with XRE-family HTH domain
LNHLREARSGRGLTMWAVAARCRVNPSLLSGIERYDYLPSVAVRERIAAALGVEVSEIWPDADQGLTDVSKPDGAPIPGCARGE